MNDRFAAEPELARTVAEILGRLRKGNYYEQALVDALGQLGSRSGVHKNYSVADAFAFTLLYADMMFGRIRWARISLGVGPGPDKCKDFNNEALRELSPQFVARFNGGCRDHDGYFGWYDHLHLGGHVNIESKLVDGPVVTSSRAEVPLEVGTQAFAKTLFMIRTGRGVARWAYDSEDIWVFKSVKSTRTVTTKCMQDPDGWPCARDRMDSSPFHFEAAKDI